MTYDKHAELFQILAHPVRLQILDELRRREACVCHLQAVTGRPQAYISQQLRVIREANLVIDEKVGQNVYYRLQSDTVKELLNIVLGASKPPSHPLNCTCPYCSGEMS